MKMQSTNKLLFVAPTVQAGWQKQSHITDFKLQKKIGSGSFGEVYRAVHKKTGKVYAIKQIKKSALDSKKLLQHARTQIKIMYSLNHPNIIKLYNHFQDQVSIFLVLQYAAKGQLFNLLKQQPDKKFCQNVAAQYIRQITQGVSQIHSQKIMHRDLKLQNILVDEKYNMKIADFGWSHFVDPQKRTTYCGTLDYLAPEMIQKGHKHDEKVDIWSIGVLIYELCTGCSPFSCNFADVNISTQNVKKNIINVNYKLPKTLSDQCLNIIKNILKLNPNDRLTNQQILNHPWIIRGQKQKDNKNIWIQNIKKQLTNMFPQDTFQNKYNDNNNNYQFTKQQIYRFTRPQSIILLKPKKNKQYPGFLTGNSNNQGSPKKNNQYPLELQQKILSMEIQKKNDDQQISRLKNQLQHKQNQIKRLMDQIGIQNKTLEHLNSQLIKNQIELREFKKKQFKN